MNKNDKQILDMLEKELKNEVEKVNVPLRLQKESIVKMLKDAERDFSANSVSTADSGREVKIAAFSNEVSDNDYTPLPAADGTAVVSKKNNNNNMIRKMLAIAAMLIIVVSGTIVMRPSDNIKSIKADTFHEAHKDEAAVKDPDSLKEIKRACEEILKNSSETAVVPNASEVVQSENKVTDEAVNPTLPASPAPEQTTEVPATIIGSYDEYIAGIKNGITGKSESEGLMSAVAPKEPEGVASYGEFTADIVKVDGEYLYIASTGINGETGAVIKQIKIIRTDSNGSMEDVSTIVLSESADGSISDDCIEIYLKDGRLSAIMERRQYTATGDAGHYAFSTVAVYYDITDPYAPVKIREHIQDGKYISSNYYEGKLCLVTTTPIPENSEDGNLTPAFSVDGIKVNINPEEVRIATKNAENSYLFITVTDVSDFTKGVGRFAFLGCGENIYCTASEVLAVREFVSVEEDEDGKYNSFAEVHRIKIDGSSASYLGWYRFSGTPVGGFSVDEESGCLRALTTDGNTNRLYIIDGNMGFVKGLDIYNGQKLTRVDFIGDNCYVMVEGEDGEKTVIIDLSDPNSPKEVETISEKAFTDELYEVSDALILGTSESRIELISEENGEDYGIVPITLTLFDVSDPSNPVTASVYSFDNEYKSIAASDSRSVMIDSEKNIIGIPAMKNDAESRAQSSTYVLFDISGNELVCMGTYEHSCTGDAAVRGVCIGDIFYTVSGEKVAAFDLNGGTAEESKLAEFPLN